MADSKETESECDPLPMARRIEKVTIASQSNTDLRNVQDQSNTQFIIISPFLAVQRLLFIATSTILVHGLVYGGAISLLVI